MRNSSTACGLRVLRLIDDPAGGAFLQRLSDKTPQALAAKSPWACARGCRTRRLPERNRPHLVAYSPDAGHDGVRVQSCPGRPAHNRGLPAPTALRDDEVKPSRL